ncbi:ABC transporter permease [Planosporangium flavigriseum]|nr:ABC transporter permease [Planosporangium flavigriseum]
MSDLFLQIGLLPILLAAMVVFFAVRETSFFSGPNVSNVGRQAVYLLLVTLGQMIVLLCAQLDLSVGATIALTSVVTASTMSNADQPTAGTIMAGMAAGLCVGLVVGLVNGIVVAFLRVPSFIVTMGSASIATGIALIMSHGAPVTGVPSEFTSMFGTGQWFGVPVPLFIGAGAIVVMYVVLSWTTFGRNIYAIGGNEVAALLAGVRVKLQLVGAFVICSLLSSLAGVLLTARVASGEATIGGSFVLLSVAAAVLGGTSLFGGEGRLAFVVLGVIFLGVLSNGMNLLLISSYVQQLVLGAVLIGAVAIDRIKPRIG